MYPWIERALYVSTGLCAGLCLVIDWFQAWLQRSRSCYWVPCSPPPPSGEVVRATNAEHCGQAVMSACLLAAVLAAVLTAFNQHLWASPAHPPTSLSPWKPGNYVVRMVAAGVLSPSNDSVLGNVARNIWLKHKKSPSACEILNRCWPLWRAWGRETERGYASEDYLASRVQFHISKMRHSVFL